MTKRRIARVVIACDSVGESRSSIEAAARLATWLDAPLRGVFVEDQALLNLAAIPSVRHVGASGETFAAVDERTIQHQFAADAARMRTTLEAAARAQERAWSFDIVRGSPNVSILDMGDQDLLVIEAESRPFAGSARLRSRLLTTALESEKSILLLRGSAGPTHGVVALVQGPTALAAPLVIHAAQLASASKQSLTLFLTNDAEDEHAIVDLVRSVSPELAKHCSSEGPQRNTLANIAATGRLLVVDADPEINSADALKSLLTITHADTLLLR